MNKRKSSANELFPIFLKLDQLQVLIIGGGSIGSEKLRFLLKSSPMANVTLVAPVVTDEIITLDTKHANVTVVKRKYISSDLIKKDIVIIATEDKDLNEEIRKNAKKLAILVNVADTPELCDFYLGSIVTKGDLKVAISTNGKSPTFAKRFRMILEEIIPDEVPEILENLEAIRKQLKVNFTEKVKILNKVTENLVVKNG